jgi:hypothetical protein
LCGEFVPERGSFARLVRRAVRIALIPLIGLVVLGALVLPSVRPGRQTSNSGSCRNNLKQIGLALHNYHEAYGCFPPAYVASSDGRPMHSWRVLLLPYLDEAPLYALYDFSQPWDSVANRYVLERMPDIYRCPSHPYPDKSLTHYSAVSGRDTVFPGATPVSISEISDGTSNTVAIGESSLLIPWTAPVDVNAPEHLAFGDPVGFATHHGEGSRFLFCDGAVRWIDQKTPRTTMRRLFLRNDGEPLPRDFW